MIKLMQQIRRRDESLRSKLHGTNPLERVNKAIKRRTNVVGFVGKTAPHAVF